MGTGGLSGDSGEGGPRWRARYQELAARDPATLDAGELEELARASFWLGRPRDVIAARQRAYGIHRDAGDHERAARSCWQLFHSHFELDETATACGWLNRARRHVDEVPDSVERGYVAIAASMWAAYSADLDEAVTHAATAHDLGRLRGDRDLAAWGLAVLGGMHVARGNVVGGVAMLDEAMIETISGELDPAVTGWIYCYLLKTCQGIGDVRRAGEWTDAAMRWCEQQGLNSWYPGLCRLHRCEVASLRGEWKAAEQEALLAAAELAPFGDYLVAEGQYLVGELRRRRGDYAGAEAAFRQAHELGHDPQPGLGLLRLAQGDTDAAARQLRVAVAGGPRPPLPRARLLAAHVQAELAVAGVEAAARSVAELAELARTTDSRLLWALLAHAHGALLLAQGDLDGALPLLREAASTCQQLGAPYEAAQVRIDLGRAARAAGDEETARLEFEAARTTFERLGARPDADRAASLAGGQVVHPRGLSDREVDVLRLVAAGLSNREVAAQLVISEHTVRRHLANIYRKIGVTSRAAATAFVFEHDLSR